ncbi:MAG: YbjN domain-containing protein [Chloroflexi bacterium]|nr:YbjN domain-containing protein [Chloroflexota bacterium]
MVLPFGRKRGTGNLIGAHAATVEQILKNIGVDPQAARMKTGRDFGWSFQRGSAIIEVYVTQQGTAGNLQVLAPLMHLPSSGLLPLYRYLLELNLQLTNAAIGVFQDVVYVYSERPLEGMDDVEANNIITLVARYADELDNRLVTEFGGRLYSQV